MIFLKTVTIDNSDDQVLLFLRHGPVAVGHLLNKLKQGYGAAFVHPQDVFFRLTSIISVESTPLPLTGFPRDAQPPQF